MVFDFNAWNLKWRDSNNHEEMEYYWNKLQEAKEDFKDDWRMFLESYNDPTHILRINYEFLDEKIEEILEKKLFIYGCAGFSFCERAFSTCSERGLLSSCGAWVEASLVARVLGLQ